MRRFIALSFAVLSLAGCNWFSGGTSTGSSSSSASVRETQNVVYRGTVLPLGASIYMEGTHRLQLEDGRFVLLESNSILLDDYLAMEVEVLGATRPTVEAGGIIMRVETIAEISESSSSSSELSSESSVSSTAAVSSAAAISSIAAPAPVSSQPPAASSAASSADALSAKTETMAKANMDASNWTQSYCAPSHVAFCVPVHRNWWYKSFGATSTSQLHVEVGPTELEILGDGPLVIALLAGAASVPDGTVQVSGGTVVGTRVWTNGRHIEIRASAALEAAVRYMTQELKASGAAQ